MLAKVGLPKAKRRVATFATGTELDLFHKQVSLVLKPKQLLKLLTLALKIEST